ncbi:Glyoxalase/Bleomycin resistance protein/Dihydroxybiphenyl dioxygenase [Elaphomyces granulatus]
MSSDQQACLDSRVGQVVWLEIPVTDINRARAFYEKVFGWTCQDEGRDSKEPGVSKLYFFSKGDFNGAFLVVDSEGLLAPAISPTGNGKDRWSVVTTFAVENVDAALQKVQDAGGKVYRPKVDIGNNMGFYGRFVDPEGNVHGIYSMRG